MKEAQMHKISKKNSQSGIINLKVVEALQER
jgi:hypothetical protein